MSIIGGEPGTRCNFVALLLSPPSSHSASKVGVKVALWRVGVVGVGGAAAGPCGGLGALEATMPTAAAVGREGGGGVGAGSDVEVGNETGSGGGGGSSVLSTAGVFVAARVAACCNTEPIA